MIKNKVKKFVAAAGLLSLSSLSAAQGPLEPVTNILVQFTSIGGVRLSVVGRFAWLRCIACESICCYGR
jgi:hypothetical protein